MRRIHIINPFENASGGSERRAIELANMLRGHAEVTLWATRTPHPGLLAEAPIRTIDPFRLRFPMRGTFVFVGVYYWLTSWIKLALPERRIIIYNTLGGGELPGFIARVAGNAARCEFVYSSAEARDEAGFPGEVEPSPIDLARFRPAGEAAARPFTIGRMSRDQRSKFHSDDPALFYLLAKDGVRVRIMGGTCLAPEMPSHPNIALIEAGTLPSEEFLGGLDCFYYRTDPGWFEAYGRVVFEAMACGLPVVCAAAAGYAAYIKTGENGFLFHSEAEAMAQITALRQDKALRQRMGHAARQTVQAIYGEEYRARVLKFYLQ